MNFQNSDAFASSLSSLSFIPGNCVSIKFKFNNHSVLLHNSLLFRHRISGIVFHSFDGCASSLIFGRLELLKFITFGPYPFRIITYSIFWGEV